MGRAELPLDPDSSPVARFAHDLRALRREAGSPTYRELARRTFYSVTSLSQAAAGRSLPTLTITLAFVEACGGDSAQWRRRWHELAATSPVEHPPPTTSAVVSVSLSAGRATSGLRLLNRHRAPVLGLVAAHRRAVSYVATVAADCPQVAGASAIAYDPAPPVWSTGTLGGWSGDGCYGEFFFESQSGRAAISPNYVQWTMRGIDATRAGCLISIFVANSAHSAGFAHYDISTLIRGTPHVIGQRIVDQGAHHGDWIGAGPFRVRGGWLRVDVNGQDPRHRDITAGAIHVYCPAG